jgi:hypothetical protein
VRCSIRTSTPAFSSTPSSLRLAESRTSTNFRK